LAKVLFVCLQNAGRSQMSQAMFERAAGGRHEARSAGTTPAQHIHPSVLAAMDEAGFDLSKRVPQGLTPELSLWPDVVVTMGCGDACPVLPGKRYIDWEIRDPKDLSTREVREIRDEISSRVVDLVKTLDMERE
jgi:arsenate reductase (thioredoxin)